MTISGGPDELRIVVEEGNAVVCRRLHKASLLDALREHELRYNMGIFTGSINLDDADMEWLRMKAEDIMRGKAKAC